MNTEKPHDIIDDDAMRFLSPVDRAKYRRISEEQAREVERLTEAERAEWVRMNFPDLAVPSIQTEPSKDHALANMHPALARRAKRALEKRDRRARSLSKRYADAMLRYDTRLDGHDEERIRRAEEKRARRAAAKAAQVEPEPLDPARDEFFAEVAEWSERSCSCHINPPCDKCVSTPTCPSHNEPCIDCGCGM